MKIKLNHRQISPVDTEHQCCKIYMYVRNIGGYRVFTRPQPTNPHCHPSIIDFSKYSGIEKICSSSILGYRQIKGGILPKHPLLTRASTT